MKIPLKLPGMNYEGHHLAGLIWPVTSSRTKETYKVQLTEEGWTCSCVGFSMHRKCKHVKEVHEKLISD